VTLAGPEREALIARYARGPRVLRDALAAAPAAALRWRPGPQTWSAHEVVCHCADSETHAASRIRILACADEPVIQDYDQDAWARDLDYHAQPLDLALDVVAAVRAATTALLRQLPAAVWTKVGRHTASGRYTGEDWLRIYAAHLEDHARQIADTVAAWHARTV
jgi:DinB family protein